MSDALARTLRLKRHGREWRGDCPACGYPGAFSLGVKNGRAVWYCASCQDRDKLSSVIRHASGCDGPRAALPAPVGPAAADHDSRKISALTLWGASIPIGGTLAETYLAARGLAGEGTTALRYCPNVRHPNASGTFPAMIALVTSTQTGHPVAVHRSYLRRDGSGKADVEPSKASKGPTSGGAIMLHPAIPGAPLVIGEGIETSLSAARMIRAPAWAAISAGNLSRITPPSEPSEIILAADPDEVGQREAWAAARLWRQQGRCVRVATPDIAGWDFNEVWRARMAQGARHG